MPLINGIVNAGYHVIRFDNRDTGLSTWIDDFNATPYSYEDMAADTIGLSLTSWMSTYWSFDPDVPAMNDELSSFFAEIMEATPPETKEAFIEENIKIFRLMSGSRFPFDEQWVRSITEKSYIRGWNTNATQNHGAAGMASPSRLETLRNLNIPTLVIHGTEDPVINYAHGVVCAKVIPGAKLLTLKGVGHEIPIEIIPETVEVILKHFGET